MLQRFEIWIFFVAILIANTAFVMAIARGLLPFGAYNYGRFVLLGGVLVAVVFAARGMGGVARMLAPLARWRVAAGWYAFALCWAVLLCLTFVAGQAALRGAWPESLTPGLSTVLRPSVAASIFIGALVGEIVWVSYAIGRLTPRHGVLPACLIVGTVWTGWWAPMVWLNVGVIPDLPMLALWINMLGVAAVCGFVYTHTGSGLLVLLLQLGVNTALVVFPVVPTTGGVATYWAFSVCYLAAALVLHRLWPPVPRIHAHTPPAIARP